MVTLFAGKTRKSYYVSADLLCHRSPYFNAALRGGFREGETLEMAFPEVKERAIGIFLDWVYRDDISIGKGDDALEVCFSLHCFARMILLEDLANLAADHIRRHYLRRFRNEPDRVVTADDISLVYNQPVSPKLRFCVCWGAALDAQQLTANERIDPEIFQLLQLGGDFPVDFAILLDFCKGFYVGSMDQILEPRLDCIFHDHRETQVCEPGTFGIGVGKRVRKAIQLLEQQLLDSEGDHSKQPSDDSDEDGFWLDRCFTGRSLDYIFFSSGAGAEPSI